MIQLIATPCSETVDPQDLRSAANAFLRTNAGLISKLKRGGHHDEVFEGISGKIDDFYLGLQALWWIAGLLEQEDPKLGEVIKKLESVFAEVAPPIQNLFLSNRERFGWGLLDCCTDAEHFNRVSGEAARLLGMKAQVDLEKIEPQEELDEQLPMPRSGKPESIHQFGRLDSRALYLSMSMKAQYRFVGLKIHRLFEPA